MRAHLVDRSGPANPLVADAPSTPPVRVTAWNVPGAPTGLVLTVGDTQLDASWTAPANTGGSGATLTGYKLRWRVQDTDSGTSGNQPGDWNSDAGVDADDATNRTHTITTLTNATVYEVQVRALNGISPGSAWSAAQSGTPAQADPTPQWVPSAAPAVTLAPGIRNLRVISYSTCVGAQATPATDGPRRLPRIAVVPFLAWRRNDAVGSTVHSCRL